MIDPFVAIGVLLIFIASISFILLILQKKFPDNSSSTLLTAVNKLLPQTQCGQCSYPGCLPYAKAIIDNTADINQCPPGGQATIDKLADLLNLPSKPLDSNLKPTPLNNLKAVIDEAKCIGCLLCIKACPVDAIIGADKQMHTVISDQCTGCELCIAPCPMDCISMQTQIIRPAHIILKDPESCR